MAFSFRLNTEVVYYRRAVSSLKLALLTYSELSNVENYAEMDERVEQILLPATNDGISNAIIAIICMASCVEAILNLSISEYIRLKRGVFHGDKDIDNIEKVYKLSIARKKSEINRMYSGIITEELNQKLIDLSDTRNKLVHSKEPRIYSGGNIIARDYKLLEREHLIRLFRTVNEFVDVFDPIIGSDVKNEFSPYIGDGDIDFDPVITTHEKFRYVLRHPIWYIFKRIPQKVQEWRRLRRLKQEIDAVLNLK